MNPRVWAFDLELNQPSNTIIQVGGCIGDLFNGKILDTFCHDIKLDEELNPYITTLTGITPEMLQQGMGLVESWKLVANLLKKHQVTPMPIVWGSGDLPTLKKQLSLQGFHIKIKSELNLKVLHQWNQMKKKVSTKGGLEASMGLYGLSFEGRPHNAKDDAVNTFRLAHILYHTHE